MHNRSLLGGRFLIRGFTLMELIIVIALLSIIGTISYIGLQEYTRNSRDSVRTVNLKTFEKGLRLIPAWGLPLPDSPVKIYSSGTLVGYQWNVGNTLFSVLWIGKTYDPLNKTNFSYVTNAARNSFQLLAFWETTGISSANLAFASFSGWVSEDKRPIVFGDEIGVFLDQNQNPIQNSANDLDIVTTSAEYYGVRNMAEVVAGTGIVLKDFTPNYLVRKMWGGWPDSPTDIAIDAAENIYIWGRYANNSAWLDNNKTIDFAGKRLLWKSSTISVDGFIAKLDKTGKQEWIKQVGWSGLDYVSNIVLDEHWNSYVAWMFYNNDGNTYWSTDFADVSLYWSTIAGWQNLFVAKLDSKGNQQWIKSIWSAWSIAGLVFSWGLYIAWNYVNDLTNSSGSKDFSGNLFPGKSSVISSDAFIAKLDENGDQVWIKNFGGSWVDSLSALQVSAGNVYVWWYYYNNSTNSSAVLDFSWSALLGKSSIETTCAFAAKLDTDGNQSWIRTLGGAYTTLATSSVSRLATNDGHLFVLGMFFNNTTNDEGITDFAGNAIYWRHGNRSNQGFVAKLDENGNQSYISSFWGLYGSQVMNLAVDRYGNAYVLGSYYNNIADFYWVKDFSGSTLLGRSTNTDSIEWNDSYDGFIAKLNPSWKQEWIKVIWWNESDYTTNISIGTNDKIYVWGRYMNDPINSKFATDFKENVLYGMSATMSDAFMATFDLLWNQLSIVTLWWTRQDSIMAIKLDSHNNALVIGYYVNDNKNSYKTLDFSWFSLLWDSDTTGTLNIFFQKIFNQK